DGSVWFGTTDGLDRWKDGRIDHYGDVSPIWFLFQDDSGRLWISTDRRFGFIESSRFVPFNGVPGGVTRWMTSDRQGDLWIANQNRGLFRVHGASEAASIPWSALGRGDFASAGAADLVQG